MVEQQDSQNENVAQGAQGSAPQQPVEGQPAAPAEQTAPQQPAQEQPQAAPAPVAEPAQETATQQPSTEEKKVEPPEMLKKAKNQPATKPEERIWSLVSYLPMVALIALIMKPDSEFVKLHGRQGLLIFIIFFFNIFIYLVPFIGPVIGIIVHFGCIGIGLFSMYQSFIGNWWKIPVLGDVAAMLPVDAFTKVTRTVVMTEKVDEEKRAEEKTEESQEASNNDSVEEQAPAEEKKVEPGQQQTQQPTEQAAPTAPSEGASPGEPPAENSGADQQQ